MLGLERPGGSPSPVFLLDHRGTGKNAAESRIDKKRGKTDRVARGRTKSNSHNTYNSFHINSHAFISLTRTHITRDTQTAFLGQARFQPTHLSSWTVPSFCAHMRSGKRTTFSNQIDQSFSPTSHSRHQAPALATSLPALSLRNIKRKSQGAI